MDNLIATIKTLISGPHRDIYNRNEQQVRRQLIDPILDSLGWLTNDPNFVWHNSQTDERDIPDYTLFNSGRIETYVEAKNLSENINNHIPQLARYCINQGIEFGILTNGNDWLVIKTFERNTRLRDRIIWQVSIENDALQTIQSKLKSISRDQIGKLPELIEKEKHLEKFWVDFVSDKNKILEKITNEITNEFLNINDVKDYDKETVNDFFAGKLSNFILEHNEMGNKSNERIGYEINEKSNLLFKTSKRKKISTPSAPEWVEKIPELRRISGLKSWKAICDHLRIPVDGDSARRRLKRWVEENRQDWPKILEPKSYN